MDLFLFDQDRFILIFYFILTKDFKGLQCFSLFFLGPLVGATGGIPEEIEEMPPVGSGLHVSTGEGGEIKIGSIRLQVVSGDITKEKTDAIVNGTNRHLDISSGKDLELNYLIHDTNNTNMIALKLQYLRVHFSQYTCIYYQYSFIFNINLSHSLYFRNISKTSGAVSKAIVKAAGHSLMAECKRKGLHQFLCVFPHILN